MFENVLPLVPQILLRVCGAVLSCLFVPPFPMSMNDDSNHLQPVHTPAGVMQIRRPALRFSPTAWAKMLQLRQMGPTELGFFGISPADDLLYVEHVVLLRQTCTRSSVILDDAAVADHFAEQAQLGRVPEQFARLWLHLHRGSSARPSDTDEQTFARVFGRMHWSVMFIAADGGSTYARLQFCVGPRAAVELPITIDWTKPFAGTMGCSWAQEYREKVEVH